MQIYANEMRVKVENSQSYYYPDIMVLCGEKKFADYRQMPSVQEYALVYQDKARNEHYCKNKEGKWEVEDIVGLDKYLKLASIDCSLDLTELYKKLKFALKKDNS
jgi:Uma2 family endonuclease